jgi:CrcB protein
MATYLWVALGGAIGTVVRYWLDGVVSNRFGQTFPLGILLINATGSLIIGLIFGLFGVEGRWMIRPPVYTFLTIGICGGYTTFSSFSLGVLKLVRQQQWFYAGSYIVLSVISCLIAVWLGFLLASAFSPRPRI